MNVVPVPPGLIDSAWPRVVELLTPAFEYGNGELELEDVLERLKDNRMWLLTIIDDGRMVAAAVLELVQYPRKRSLRIVALGGSGLENWMVELQRATNEMAKRVDASFVEIQGRPGWERALRKLERVRPYAVVMTMEVV